MPPASLTVVLPAFNEEDRLGSALDELFGYLRRRGGPAREGSVGADGAAPDRPRPGRGRRQHGRDRRPRPRQAGVQLAAGGPPARPARGVPRRQGRGGPGGDAGRRFGPGRLRRRRHGHAAGPAAAAGGSPWPITTWRWAAGSSPTAGTCAGRSRATAGCSAGSSTPVASIWVIGPVKDTQCGFKGFTRAAAQDLFKPPEGDQHRLRRRADPPRPAARLPDRDRADPVVRQARLADARPAGPGPAGGLGPVPDPAPPSAWLTGRTEPPGCQSPRWPA